MGAFWLKTPSELGGTPLARLDFCDVMEEFAYADTSTACMVMVGNGSTGTAGGWLPDAGARQVFAPGGRRPLIVGTPGSRGAGRPVSGGYVVTGRWGFGSGIANSDWVIGGFTVDGTSAARWSASSPGSTSRSPTTGTLFRQEAHVFLSNEVPPLCVGMARRVLDEMTEMASRTARFPGGAALSERAVFHSELGRAETGVKAARLLHRDTVEAAWAAARALPARLPRRPPAHRGLRGELRAGWPPPHPVVQRVRLVACRN
jgi:alkylation response protein AidB-like acyl-CoA dehydrogenase